MEEPVTNQFNFQNLWNIEVPKLLEEKFITIQVHEAKLNHKATTSSGGKLATFAKLQISTLVWTTKLDKDSTLNPRWDQSKTFQRKTLEKYSKSEERIVGNVIIRQFLPHRPSDKNAQPAQDQTPNLILGVYHYSSSSLMEALVFYSDCKHSSSLKIGETKIPLQDILKKNSQNGWFDITNGSQISGSVHLSFQYDDQERDTSKANSQSYDRKQPAESRSQTPTYKNTIKPSSSGTPFSLDESQSNLLSIYSNYNVTNDDEEDEIIQNFSVYQPFTFEKSLLNKSCTKSSQAQNHKQTPGEDQYDSAAVSTNATPIKESGKPRERQTTYSSDNLLTTKFTEEDNYSPEKIVYNITFTTEDLEEPVVLPKDRPQKIIEVGQIQDTLQDMQKDNTELKQKQEEFAVSFANIKANFEKLVSEKNILSSRMNDLSLREQCLINEKRNLSKDFQELQQEQDRFYNESQQNEMQLMLEEAQKDEYEETERTLELEENLKQIALFYQRETQNMRALEQEMYRKLIGQRIKEHNLMSEVQPESERIMVSMVEGYEKAPEPEQEEEEIDYEALLQDIQDKQFEIETSIEARIQNIERLQDLLKTEPAEDEIEREIENNDGNE